MKKITIEQVMDTLDMFQSTFGILDEFGWWDLEKVLADASKQFTLKKLKTNIKITKFI